MKLKIHYFLLAGLFGIAGCISPPVYPDKPKITLKSVSRTEVSQPDSLRVVFEFTDGDGDLGFEALDPAACDICADSSSDSSCLKHPTFSLFVKDTRTDCFVTYNIPYIPPKGSSDAISGKIDVVLSSICCIHQDGTVCVPKASHPYDTVIYSLQIKDRAGNFSNKITTPPIVISCNE